MSKIQSLAACCHYINHKKERKTTTPFDENIIALFQAIKNKDAQMVLEALKNRADANARDGAGTGALKYAMAFGDGSIN